MFKHLQEIDYKVYERYLTLEKNIKAGSNSFYDAYLDLQEQFVKDVAIFCGFDVKAKETCGELLRREDVKNFFKDVLGVDDFTYTKMQDYTLKVNAHKHKGEKHIQIDTIVSYMRIIYDATIAFAIYKKVEINEFDANYFISIFGAFEKENAVLKTEMGKLKEELLRADTSASLSMQHFDTFKKNFKKYLSSMFDEITVCDLDENYMPIIDNTKIGAVASASLKVAIRLSFVLALFNESIDSEDVACSHLGILLLDSPKDKDLDNNRFDSFLKNINDECVGQVIITGSISDEQIYTSNLTTATFFEVLKTNKKLLKEQS